MATMPSKKRKYNARFPAGRIKKIMQTDEEVGKVAQAVPIIISVPRTLELFVASLLRQALHVTVNRNAKTLSPSHVKHCILAESRFDFLRDLVKNIPDVSAAEEKELMSAESSPTSSRFSEASTQSNCDSRVQTTPPQTPRERDLKRAVSVDAEIPSKMIKIEPLLLTAPPRTEPYFPVAKTEHSTTMPEAIDLTKRPVRTANFYQETLITEEVQHKSVIKLNPTYSSPQPSTSYTNLNPVPALHRIEIPAPKPSFERHNSLPRTPNTPRPPTPRTPNTPRTPITPLINIDFSKNLTNPEIKVLDTAVVQKETLAKIKNVCSRQNSKSKIEVKKVEAKPTPQAVPVDIDILNSGNLQIDEDYDT